MKRPAIPRVPPSDREREAFDSAVKESLELVTGRGGRGTAIKLLPSDATLSDVVAKINELINTMQ